MDFLLILGGVVFEEFEVPESIKGGGKQALAIHKYPGGLRTIDTTGPDDNSLTWSGHFEDEDADSRCQQIDTMRRQGAAIQLAWANHLYVVVIESFEWDFKRFYHIPYSISLAVIQDLTQPGIFGLGGAIEALLQGDIGDALVDALGFAAGVSSGLAGAVEGVQATAETVPAISTASTPFVVGLGVQVAAASVIANATLSSTDAEMSDAGKPENFASGTDPVTMAANVNNLVIAATAMPLAFDAVNRLSRLGKNLAAVAA